MKCINRVIFTLILTILSCSKSVENGNDLDNDNADRITFNLIEFWSPRISYPTNEKIASYTDHCDFRINNSQYSFSPRFHFNVNKLVLDFKTVNSSYPNIAIEINEDEETSKSVPGVNWWEQRSRRPFKINYIQVSNYNNNKKLILITEESLGSFSQERLVDYLIREHGPIVYYDSNVDFIEFLQNNLVDQKCQPFSSENINRLFRKEEYIAENFKRTESFSNEEIFSIVLTSKDNNSFEERGENIKAKDLRVGDIIEIKVSSDANDFFGTYYGYYKILEKNP